MRYYLGVDVGSISAKGVILDEEAAVVAVCYLRTQGRPIDAVKEVLRRLRDQRAVRIEGVGTTGSARKLAGIFLSADVVKNEIIAHAVASAHHHPGVRTILEIGGQDSKLIVLSDGIPVDFAMNTVCAAGTGSFLDHQAIRLGVPIEEFGDLAIGATRSVHIASRCTVFAESDMIHKTQLGIPRESIIAGLCEAIVRNYLSTVAKGKDIRPPILFQGGVAANQGVRRAFERALGMEVLVPEHFLVMGAVGAAMLAARAQPERPRFPGFEACTDLEFESRGFECGDCANTCEVVEALREREVVARYGGRCGKWD